MTKTEYANKTKRLEELLLIISSKQKLSKNLQQELDNLSDEIADYEETRFPFEASNLKEMIELRMYQRKLKQKDIAKILGTTPSRISELLNGKRGLTMELARGLHKKLNIDAELILNNALQPSRT